MTVTVIPRAGVGHRGAELRSSLCREHRDKPMAFVDGKVVLAPDVCSDLSDELTLAGKMSKAEAERIAKGIRGK